MEGGKVERWDAEGCEVEGWDAERWDAERWDAERWDAGCRLSAFSPGVGRHHVFANN